MKQPKEPIRTPWIWGVFAVLFVLLIPWYFPAGPGVLIGGVPLWALVILGVSLALSVFIHYVLVRHWAIEAEDDG